MDAQLRHAFADRERQEHDDDFNPSKHGESIGDSDDSDSDAPAQEADFNPDAWGKSYFFLRHDLIKGQFHKYLRRVPTGDPKKPYRYVYSIASTAHARTESVKLGEKVRVADDGKEGHYEVTKLDGDTVHITHDETGKVLTVSQQHLHDTFAREHALNIATKHAVSVDYFLMIITQKVLITVLH